VTGVLVTHDQEEALEVSDRIVVLNGGRVEQAGRPDEVYDRPASPFVVRFFGEANRLTVQRDGGRLALLGVGPDHRDSDSLLGMLRPNDVALSLTPADGALAVVVVRARRTGPRVHLDLHAASDATLDAELTLERFSELDLQPGDRAFVLPRNVHVFDASGQVAAAPTRGPVLAH
jgi:sulfate/thiosulfate transport system ATP-binding protein